MCEEEGWLHAWRDMGVRSDLVSWKGAALSCPRTSVQAWRASCSVGAPSSPQDYAGAGVFVSLTLAGAKMSHEDSMRPLRKTQDLREPRRP